MKEKVKKTIKKYNLLDKGERIVVAHSGGPDSTALLAVLAQIAPDMNLTLIVAHFNHRLRGRESDADENFSRDLARKMGLLFFSGKMDKKSDRKGISPEDFYRRQRYNFLDKVAKDNRAQKIAMGHNLQDQAETVLLNLLRGSGLEGLKGFLPKRDGKIIRPLMEISREEIVSFLEESGISYRIDKTNKDNKHLRNKIRMHLIPYLKENYNPKIEENLAQMAAILRNEDEFIKQHVVKVMQSSAMQKSKNHISLKLNFLKKLFPAIRWRLFKMILEDLSPANNGISFAHVMSLDNLVEKKVSGKKVNFPLKIIARREYDNLILERKKNPSKKIKYKYSLVIPGTTYIKEKNLTIKSKLVKKRSFDLSSKNNIYLDWDKIEQPVVIRNRRDGDWFQPLGMRGRQKIKNYFIDHKIPVNKRDEIMLLVDHISVIWIENMRLNDRVKISPETKNVLKLEINS